MSHVTVAADLDRIQNPPDMPGWSENLVAQTYDPTAGISVWAHWSRIPGSPHIWESIIAVYLQGDELLVSRSFGPSPARQSASSGPLSFECVEPNETWRLRFDGMALRSTAEALSRQSLADGEVERLTVDVQFSGVHPTWSLHGELTGQVWASAHLEQGCRTRGEVVTTAGTVPIDSFGFRDHSYGPRDYSGMIGDTWCSAVFPSGRALLALKVWQFESAPLTVGFVWDGATLHNASHVDVPPMHDRAGAPASFFGTITTELGVEQFEVVSDHRMTWTMHQPVGMSAGTRSDGDLMHCVERPALVTWSGERTAGWFEKALRPSRFTAPGQN
ncbi:hypothetical protein [Mycobacterium sp.]|uniref:hypothetical protein n=1 Tax=Mycobacterium sp. TaxID=1785 RepID=UPI001211CBBF|nr:hypothetical protein [Mycobacterium sp.]TAM72123.1 MAG: hypothetical protein EPN51_03580 [Mycobacterium sp.]